MPSRKIAEAHERPERIKYFFDHAGALGYQQTLHYYHKLGECYRSAAMDPADGPVVHAIYLEAGNQ